MIFDKQLISFFLTLLLTYTSFSQNNFIKNDGQLPKKVFSKANFSQGAFFVETGGFTYNLLDKKKLRDIHEGFSEDSYIDAHSYQLSFINSIKSHETDYIEPRNYYENYYVGPKENWVENARAYNKIKRPLYEGIFYVIYFEGNNIKYDIHVEKNYDPGNIQIEYNYVDDIKLTKNNTIIIKASFTEVEEKIPEVYQIINGKKIYVDCKYQLKNNVVSFSFPNGYNKNYDLVIDPELVFSTYSGSSADNFGYTATYDKQGNLYAGSISFGPGYPTTLGAYQLNFNGGVGNGGTDIAITKYNNTGTQRIYSTYLGGSFDELPHSMIVSDLGELYIFGTTGSEDFPTTESSFDTTFNGGTNFVPNGIGASFPNGSDIIISKLSSSGGQLVASTFFGGDLNDGLNNSSKLTFNYADEVRGEIEIDSDNNVVVGTCTRSKDFPTLNPIQPILSSGLEGCIFKLDRHLSNIIWSTYFGGSGDDCIYSVDFNRNNDIVFGGGTTSSDLNTTPSAFQQSYNSSNALSPDGFITTIDNNADSILFSTYFGTDLYDQVFFIDVTKNDQVHVLGQTNDTSNFFIKNSTISTQKSGQFISTLSSSLSSLIRSSAIGSGKGTPDISPTAFMVDLCNSYYLSGWGSSINGQLSTLNLPTSDSAFQITTDGNDFYFMVISESMDNVDYATFFGGNVSREHVDGGTSRFDNKGVIYQSVCAGCDGNNDFPVKPNPGAVSTTNNSPNCNNGVFKFDMNTPLVVSDFQAPLIGCDLTIQFNNLTDTISNTLFYWDFGDGNSSNQHSPIHTYDTTGNYLVRLISIDSLSCNISDTIQKELYILGNQKKSAPELFKCKYEKIRIGLNNPISINSSYSWSPINGLSSYNIQRPFTNIDSTIEYTLVINYNNSCFDTIIQKVNVDDISVLASDDTSYCNDSIILTAVSNDSSANFIWSSDFNFTNILSSGDSIKAIQVMTYFVRADNGNCFSRDSVSIKSENIDISLDGDNSICFGDSSLIIVNNLVPGNPIQSYNWNESISSFGADSSQVYVIPEFSKYYEVEVINNLGCKINDSIYVEVIQRPTIDSLWVSDSLIFYGQEITLSLLTDFPYSWSNNNQNKSFTLNLYSDEMFFVEVNNNGCVEKDSIFIKVRDYNCDLSKIDIPNAFSPNGDQINDFYRVTDYDGVVERFHILIYNRLGQKVFESKNIFDYWDGRYDGNVLTNQVFDFYLNIRCYGNKEFIYKGNINLIR